MKPVLIVGGGFSGLTSAYFLNKAGFEVEVVDARPTTGGLLGTTITPNGIVESAANGMLASASVEAIATEIGVQLQTTRRDARRRYICTDRPRQWPFTVAQSIGVGAKLTRMLVRKQKFKPDPYESLKDWALRALGETFYEQLLAPATLGIYAGNPSRLSASLVLKRIFDPALRAPRGHLRGTVAPVGGMGEWIAKLADYLRREGVKIHTGQTISSLPQDHTVVVATSARSASRLLASTHKRLSEQLAEIELLPVATITIFFDRSENVKRPRGFGMLFSQNTVAIPGVLGVLMNDWIFEGRAQQWSETWILGGHFARRICQHSDAELMAMIQKVRRSIIGEQTPNAYHVQRWPEALPHYTVDLEHILSEMQIPHDLYLIGNYLGDLGLSHIVERARRLAFDLKKEN